MRLVERVLGHQHRYRVAVSVTVSQFWVLSPLVRRGWQRQRMRLSPSVALLLLLRTAMAQPNCPRAGAVSSCTPIACSALAQPLGCHNASRPFGKLIDQPVGCKDTEMTRERCFEFCNGTRYAALESGSQCWCGNTLGAATPVGSWCVAPKHMPVCSQTDCLEHENHTGTKPCCCTGNASQSCGGFNAIELFDIEHVRCAPKRLSAPFCNESLPIEQRVADLTDRATWQEKLSMLNHKNRGIRRLAVPKFQYSECLHGVETKCGVPSAGNSTGCPTSFPCALGSSASFNSSLFRVLGQAIGREARAFFNQGKTGLSMWAPDLNLFRTPVWGRGQEVPSGIYTHSPFL